MINFTDEQAPGNVRLTTGIDDKGQFVVYAIAADGFKQPIVILRRDGMLERTFMGRKNKAVDFGFLTDYRDRIVLHT